ncbi:amidohydrolase family protein [Agromyces silvae]|uniref:amidohydrolase family protein n=1 Tax=Agromyces silvae TaxID=3388266 RepID=UPI00280AB89D|nr:amidohydrolase family protein [Agromyces protaetiae]
MITDAHTHLWDRRRFRYDWLDQEPALPRRFLADDLAASSDLSERFVFVQADTAAAEGYDEAAWVESLDPGHERLAGIVAYAPLEHQDAERALDALASIPSVVGVRRLLQQEPDEFLAAPALHAGLRAVAGRGWTFDACVRWRQLPALADLAARHPALAIVLDHLGKPPLRSGPNSDAFTEWRLHLQRLAALPNVSVKLSGLPAEADRGLGADYGPWLRCATELFGPDRSMLGSDWPVSAVGFSSSRDDWFRIVQQCLAPSEAEWRAVSDLTAKRFYGLEG